MLNFPCLDLWYRTRIFVKILQKTLWPKKLEQTSIDPQLRKLPTKIKRRLNNIFCVNLIKKPLTIKKRVKLNTNCGRFNLNKKTRITVLQQKCQPSTRQSTNNWKNFNLLRHKLCFRKEHMRRMHVKRLLPKRTTEANSQVFSKVA